MFLEVAGRAASSADNAQATSFFMINDEGIWLIKRPRGAEALELLHADPAALGGPHGGRLAVVRQRGQAQGLRRALRDPREAVAVLPGLERPDHQRARHDLLPARRRQHAPVHQRAADPAVGAARQGAAVHRRLEPFRPSNAMEWAALGGVQARPRGPDPLPADRRPQARPRRLRQSIDAPAPLGSITTVRTDYEAHFLLQNLMLTGEALRLGGVGARRADDPARLAARSRQGRPRPRLPRVQREDVRLALEALAAGARLAARTTSASTACSRACARRTSTTWTRRSTRCSRRSSAPGGTYTNAEVFAQSYKDKATAETYMKHAGHPPAEAIEYTKEICRYLVDTYGRFPAHTDAVPPAGHLAAVLAPGDRVLRAVRATRATSSARPRGGRSGTAIDDVRERARPDDRPHAVHADPPAVGVAAARSGCRSPGTCRSWAATSCSSTSSSSCAGRSCAKLDGEQLHYQYLFFESNFDGPWQHYIDAFAYVIPLTSGSPGGAARASRRRRRPSR